MKRNKFLAVLLALSVIFSFMVPMASASGYEIEISIADGNTSNIYSAKDDITFEAIYTNTSGADLANATATVVVTNDTLGEQVGTASDTITVTNTLRETKTYSGLLNNRSYGNLTITVTLANGGQTLATASKSFTRVHNDETVNDSLGYNSNYGFEWKDSSWTNETADLIIDACQKSGIGYIRDGIEWQVAEENAGANQLPADAVAFYKKITDAGIKVMYNVLYGNTNYQGTAHTDMPTEETSRAKFAEFCSNVATQLNGMVFDYAIWNEPDLSYANTNGATGADYAALIQAAYNAITGVNTNNNVIGLMVSSKFSDTFETAAKNAGALNYMDAAAFTTYFNDKEPHETFDDYVDTSKSFIGTNKSLWASEMGANTYANTEEASAAKLAKIVAMQKENGNLDKMFIYALMDKAGGATGAELYFGQIRADGSVKPAFSTIAFANSIVTNATSKGMTETKVVTKNGWIGTLGEKVAYVRDYRFEKADGKKVAAVWTKEKEGDDPSYTVSFDAESGKEIFVYDMYGNLKTHTTASSVSLTSVNEPQYVVYAVPDADTGTGEEVETEIAETCEIAASNGVITISGTTKEKYVSAYAFADGATILESVDMEQFTVGADGAFSGTINVPADGIYAVKVSAGISSENLLSTQKLTALFDFYADGVKLGSLAELKEAASANSKIEAEIIEATDDVLGIIAVYNGEQLSDAVTDSDADDGVVVLDDIDMSADTKIKMMLWNKINGLTPYVGPIQVK